jgi:hypothetical protein
MVVEKAGECVFLFLQLVKQGWLWEYIFFPSSSVETKMSSQEASEG